MKKLLALTLTLTMILTLTACSMSNQELYEQAQLYLGNREYAYAASLFGSLGEYRDAADYALYAAALDALESGDVVLARHTLDTLHGFKSTDRYLAYLDADQLANEGRIDEALLAYEQLGAFYHSAEQAEEMRALRRQATLHEAALQLKAGQIDEARALLAPYAANEEAQQLLTNCDEADAQLAYDAAQDLYAQGKYLEAYDAFVALGMAMDAPIRAQLCRSALYRQAEEAYPQATLSNAGDLMALYDKLSGYLNADVRFEALCDAFGTRLNIIQEATAHPYVTYGSAFHADNGAVLPVVWQVLTADETSAVLVCCAALTDAAAATPTDMDLTIPETPAQPVLSAPMPRTMDADALQAMLDEDDALQAILTEDDSLCARFMTMLTDAPNASLCGCVPADETGGLRPIIAVSMTDWTLSGGLGTWTDPYR